MFLLWRDECHGMEDLCSHLPMHFIAFINIRLENFLDYIVNCPLPKSSKLKLTFVIFSKEKHPYFSASVNCNGLTSPLEEFS